MQRFFVLLATLPLPVWSLLFYTSVVHINLYLQGLVDIGITVSLQDRLR